jgi:hypothetical protein
VTVTATITDNVGVTSGTVYYNDGSGLQNKAMTNSGTTYTGIIGPFAAGKTVSYYVEAKDAAANTAKSPSGSFTVQGTADTTKPTIAGVTNTPALPTSSDSVTIGATITDNVGVTSAEVKYNDGSGEKTATMTKGSGNSYTADIGKFAEGATVTYHVEAKDAAANLQKSPDATFTIQVAGQAPDVTVTAIKLTPASPKVGETVTIKATVTNSGAGAASNVAVKFSIGGVKIDEKIIASLAAGATTDISTTWVGQSVGQQTLEVKATVSGDSNTGNDAMTSNFNVATSGGGGGTTGTGSSSMLMWIVPIIVIVVVVIVLAMLMMRRKKPAQQPYYQQDMFGGQQQY